MTTFNNLQAEWDAKFDEEAKKKGMGGLARLFVKAFMHRYALAAARASAEAGKVTQRECPNHGEDNGRPVQCYGYDEEYNSAIAQSERQINSFFEGTV